MRVYYISSGLQGCYYVRCLLPMQANGWDGDQTAMFETIKADDKRALAAQNSDIVVFHRPDDPRKLELAKYLKKKHGKKIVFDNDDTYKDDGGFRLNEYMNEERMKNGLKRINETIDEFITDVADLVTCSTDFLNKEYSKLHDNVVTLPNCVEPLDFDEPLRNEDDVFRIGITGSIAITSDFERLLPIIQHYQNDKRVRFVLFSLPPNDDNKMMRELYSEEYKAVESLDLEWHTFVPQYEYFDKVNSLKLDLQIIPRAETYFNQCKSNLKFLEGSMFEIPTIAQSFTDGTSPYEVNPLDKQNMVLAANTEEFISWIEHFINNRDKARELGKKARAYVEDNYDINTYGTRWEEAYNSII